MKHTIMFHNHDNHWDNGLPLGNSNFGGMVYYEKNRLYLPLTHYEIYHNFSKQILEADVHLSKVFPDEIYESMPPIKDAGVAHAQKRRIADGNVPKNGEPFYSYRLDKEADAKRKTPYAIFEFSGSYPETGTLSFTFAPALADADSHLYLYTEDAKVQLQLKQDEASLTMDTIVARKDCVITKVTQNQSLLQSISIAMMPYRDFDAPPVQFTQIDNRTFIYTVERKLTKQSPAPFVFSGIIRLVGAEGALSSEEFRADIQLTRADQEFHILTGIFTDFHYPVPATDGLVTMNQWEAGLSGLYEEHRCYWQRFFNESSISLPDKFLEHIYFINQYALDCCSGEDGVMKHQACGLNGLWATKHPNLWGSMWYWDVNIQAAFAGVFSSNHLHLGKVFSDGLRMYTKLARRFAQEVHGMTGLSIDYPYDFYYSTWPWCAQYLWFLYEYSMDEDYLRNEAYPVFLELCEFTTQVFEYDAATDTYHIYPDVSPEQGPLAHDTTITVSSVKYLLQFTLKAAEILGDDSPILEQCRTLLYKLPEYPLSKPGKYGVHVNDSPDAPDDLWIRHPGMLMPLFPVGEYDMNSDPEMQQVFSNTIDFLEDNCEIGIFQSSWLAAAAARLGRGQTALRLLYERGIDHMLRSNGLSAEETDHFINYCLTARQPLYYPCMMEFTGEMLAAVNEMLLQSHNDLIRVFPALPDGDREYARLHRRGHSLNEFQFRHVEYAAWNTVRFDKLLAKGAFEVSASLEDEKLQWIHINSRKGGMVHVTSPFMSGSEKVFCGSDVLSFTKDGNIIHFQTEAGKEYTIAASAGAYSPATQDDSINPQVMKRLTYTKRQIHLGGDADTEYEKAMDKFLRSWYHGNLRFENRTVYKFDFGCVDAKDYGAILEPQAACAENMKMQYLPFHTVGADSFTPRIGYGFADASGITAVDRNAPDGLRRDFVEGTEDAEFLIEVPRGQYDLLAVSGDAQEDSITKICVESGRSGGGQLVKAGSFQCKLLPLVLEEDGFIRVKLSTEPGYRWKLNLLLLNAIKGY